MRVAYSSILIAFTGLASLAASADAAVVEGRLLAATFRGRVTRGVSMKTKVVLGGGRYQTQVARDGTFEFPDVAAGTYILEVQSPHLVYSRPPEGQKVVGFFGHPMILMASFSLMKQHQAYSMDGTLDTFQNQSAPYYNEKSHHDFVTTPATNLAAPGIVGINHGLYQAYPAAFGDQWTQQQQQQAAAAGGVVPVQSKKQK
ncbi:hypothetical protein BGW39_006626 [Mortierella sp. 14UC]|nr:hypothetical protein BGW39_006626 [Mortierella sp. 14UC]